MSNILANFGKKLLLKIGPKFGPKFGLKLWSKTQSKVSRFQFAKCLLNSDKFEMTFRIKIWVSDTFSVSATASASASARVILGVSSAQIDSDWLSFDNIRVA